MIVLFITLTAEETSMFNKGKEMWNKFKGDETWLEAD
jgi:hypothetical protein